MSTPTEAPNAAPTFALDEDAMRKFVAEKNPELIADDPAGPGPETETLEEEAAPPETPPEEVKSDDTPPAEDAPPEDDEAKKQQEEADAKKKADEEAAQKAKETAAKAEANPDLEEETKKIDPHTKPKTRKIIDTFKQKAIEARERAKQIEQEKAQIAKEAEELRAQIKAGAPPKEMEEELKLLRERVRELDVTKDPAIENKYDKPMAKNTDAAIELLGQNGLFQVAMKDEKGVVTYRAMNDREKADVTARIKAGGVSVRTMAQYIKSLEAAGEVESAEVLREYARENDRLIREKGTEVESAKTNFESRTQAKTKEQQAQQEQLRAITTNVSTKTLQADIAELAKAYPAIGLPPDPLPTDSAAVAAAKKTAKEEYGKVAAQVTEAVKAFNPDGLAPDKAAEAQGRMAAAAVKAVILQSHVLPKMVKERQALEARVKELEAQVGKFRGAGAINRAHSAAISAQQPNGEQRQPAPASVPLADAAKDFFKGRGIDVNT